MNTHIILQDLLKLLAVICLVLLNGFFVAAELALVRLRGTQLDDLVKKGSRRAIVAQHVIGRIHAYIGATQFGITLASLALGIAVEPVFRDLLAPLFRLFNVTSDAVQHNVAIGVGFFVNSYLLIVVGELAPKAIAINRTKETALLTAWPLVWFYRISYPFIWVLNRSSQWILGQMGIEGAALSEGHSEDELRSLVKSGQGDSSSAEFQRYLVLNALDLGKRLAREVMRPRREIVAFDTEASIAACVEIAEKTRYSRFPLCEEGDLDRTRGWVHIKDLYALRLKAQKGGDLLAVARKLVYAPETARLDRLMQILLQRRTHAVVVVDEYGSTVGLLTLENILEELVGQIQDEFDQEKPLLTRLSDGTWEMDGLLPLHELSELTGETLATEGVTTVSGWVTHQRGGFPKQDDMIRIGQYRLQVASVDGMRVGKLRLTKLAAVEPDDVSPGRS